MPPKRLTKTEEKVQIPLGSFNLKGGTQKVPPFKLIEPADDPQIFEIPPEPSRGEAMAPQKYIKAGLGLPVHRKPLSV